MGKVDPKRARTPTHEPSERGEAVSWAHVDELKPNPRNPRTHGPEVLALARTIVRTAWGAPIVAQTATRRIIGGHGRLEAAYQILSGIEIDGELRGGAGYLFDPSAPGPGYVPVRWVDVNDATADAMTIADNAQAIQGTDDLAALQAMASGVADSIRFDLGVDQERMSARIEAAANAIIKANELDPSDAFAGLPSGDKQPFQQMTFTLHDSQAEIVAEALARAKSSESFEGSPNENSNGNGLAALAEAYLRG